MSIFSKIRPASDVPLAVQHDPNAPILKLSDVTVRYNGTAALSNISFELQPGERVAVVGPNGAGKSTLFKAVAGVLDTSRGSVTIGGYEPQGHICIAYVPQRTDVDWEFPVTVSDVVMMGRVSKLGLFRWPKTRDRQLVQEVLELVGLTPLAEQQISELSGGQQQRMFIARALAQEAELMLMDEPLTGLDLPAQDDIFHILNLLRARNVTVLVATHDLDLASSRFDRVMLFNRQLLGIGAAAQVFTPENLRAAYGNHVQLIETEDGVMIVTDTHCDDGHSH